MGRRIRRKPDTCAVFNMPEDACQTFSGRPYRKNCIPKKVVTTLGSWTAVDRVSDRVILQGKPPVTKLVERSEEQ